MSLDTAFAPAEAHYRNLVLHETWGHLAPAQGQKHAGSLLFAHAGYGGHLVILRSDFPTVEDSPWFFDHMMDFVRKHDTEPGSVYRFTGTYVMFKNGNCRFSGQVTEELK